MGDAYVTLPLGEDSVGYPEHSPSAPEQPHAFLPRPPATAPIGMAEAQPLSKFDVHVVEPTKSGNGYNAFVAYKVVCRTSMENYMSNDISMMRRFNHFVWLHVQLSEQYPCYFIPVLPDKSGIDPYFNRFDAEFIERRRWALQQFLFRIVQHPVLMASKALQVFLEGDENQMRLPEDKKPSLFGGLFKSNSQPPKAVQDPEFVAMGQYIKEFEAQLFEVHKFMERLVIRRKELGSSLGELGLTLITMGTHEEKTGEPEAATSSKSFHDLGSCCDHLAISLQEQVKDEMQKSVFVLEEWLRMVEGVKESLRTQAGSAGMYFAFLTDLDKKERAMQKGQQGGKPITEADISEAQRRVEEARQRAEMLGQRLRDEMTRFKKAKAVELRTMLFRFVEIQIKSGFVVTESWQRALSSVVKGIDPAILPNGGLGTEGYV